MRNYNGIHHNMLYEIWHKNRTKFFWVILLVITDWCQQRSVTKNNLLMECWFEVLQQETLNRIDRICLQARKAKKKDLQQLSRKPLNLLVAGAGFEPATFGLWARRATELLHPAFREKEYIRFWDIVNNIIALILLFWAPRPKSFPWPHQERGWACPLYWYRQGL